MRKMAKKSTKSDLLWAAGVNGEGSSMVTHQFIQAIIDNNTFTDICIVYTAESTLSGKLQALEPSTLKNLSYRRVCFVKLPKTLRNYGIHFFIKALFPVEIFFRRTFVFDDFPFRLCSRQLLYFHQPNLIFSESLVWQIKRMAFQVLKTGDLTINFQTRHIRSSFLQRFGTCKSLCLLHLP